MTGQTGTAAHVGIDLGTSSVKVLLVDDLGEQVSQASATYPVLHPRPGWAESAPLDWWNATVSAVRSALAQAPQARPVSIGLSGQMHGVVATRADGDPVRNAVLWADSRAEEQLALYRDLPSDARYRLANPLSPGMAGPILAWIVRHEFDVAAAMRWALQPKDWLRLQLTGEVCTEPSDASATLLFDVVGQSWDLEVAAALGIPVGALPTVLPSSGTQAGHLTTTAADVLGLPSGLPVAAGAADTAAAAFGSGLIESGTAQLTIGTGVQVVTPSNDPPAHQADPVTHYYRAATEAGHYRMAAVLNGGLALKWVCDLLNASWGELYSAAEREGQAHDPVFLPHLNGERTPYMDASMRGAWTSLSPQHTRTDLLRSALEGVAFATAEAVEALFRGGQGLDHLRLAGGGTTAPAWRQLLADVIGTELRAVAVPDASARGAALLGARAAGLMDEQVAVARATPRVMSVVSPDARLWTHYRDRRTAFRQTADRLRAVRPQRGDAPAAPAEPHSDPPRLLAPVTNS